MLLIVIIWIMLALIGIKYNDKTTDTAFTLHNSIALRGICSIEIMIGHLGAATGSMALFPNRKAGILFVGVFFALSGYGLMYSVTNKVDYLTKFISNRMKKILIPAYVVFFVTIILHSIMNQDMLCLINVINPKVFFQTTNWYIWELLMLYFVFYMSIKMEKGKKFHFIILLFSIFFVCIAYGCDFENPWYGSTFCFWLGIIYFIYKDKFMEMFVLKNPTVKMICLCIVMSASICLFFVEWGVIGLLIARNIASVVFTIILIIFLHWFCLGNKITIWLGKYSYEIFLLHPLFIEILRPWIETDIVYAFSVIGLTVLSFYMYKELVKNLKNSVIKSTK